MIDIHTHVLPAVDDGAHDEDESLAMLQLAAAAGTTDIVATPHHNFHYQFEPEQAAAALRELRAKAAGGCRLHLGCELLFSADSIREVLAEPRKYALNRQSCVLVEFPPMGVPPRAADVLEQMLGAGIVPVVAHPERNPVLAKDLDRLARWVDMGVLMQITGQSLTGRFGRQGRGAAHEMLGRGLAHFVASDAHDALHRPPSLKEAYALVEHRYGVDTAECLFIDNPGAAISGRPVASCPAPAKRKRWFFF